MKKIHAVQRAEERYSIIDFKPQLAMSEIMEGRTIQIKEDIEKFSRIFLIRYNNKYVSVVTDYNVQFVKTALPQVSDLDLINLYIEKTMTQAA